MRTALAAQRTTAACAIALALALLSSCAALAPPPTTQPSELAAATLRYDQITIAYSVAVQTMRNLRAEHRADGGPVVSDPVWRSFSQIEASAALASGQVRDLLATWASTGVKPSNADYAMASFQAAVNTLATIQAQAQASQVGVHS